MNKSTTVSTATNEMNWYSEEAYWVRLLTFRAKLNQSMWSLMWEHDIDVEDLVDVLKSWNKDIEEEVKKVKKQYE